MDKCKSCLMLREVRKLKIEQIKFDDSEDAPAYCRACYQSERGKADKLKKALRDCVREQYNGSFPDQQCAANRGRMLLEELDLR